MSDDDCVYLCYLLGFKGVYFDVWDYRPWLTIRVQGMISTINHGDKIGGNDKNIPLDQPFTDRETLKACTEQVEKKKRWINRTLELYVNTTDDNG